MTSSDEERVRGLLHLLGLARACLYLPDATPAEQEHWRAEIHTALAHLAEVYLSDPGRPPPPRPRSSPDEVTVTPVASVLFAPGFETRAGAGHISSRLHVLRVLPPTP
jgi:hypothetical protein